MMMTRTVVAMIVGMHNRSNARRVLTVRHTIVCVMPATSQHGMNQHAGGGQNGGNKMRHGTGPGWSAERGFDSILQLTRNCCWVYSEFF